MMGRQALILVLGFLCLVPTAFAEDDKFSAVQAKIKQISETFEDKSRAVKMKAAFGDFETYLVTVKNKEGYYFLVEPRDAESAKVDLEIFLLNQADLSHKVIRIPKNNVTGVNFSSAVTNADLDLYDLILIKPYDAKVSFLDFLAQQDSKARYKVEKIEAFELLK